MSTKYNTWRDVANDLLDDKEVTLYFAFYCTAEHHRTDVFKIKFIKGDVREFGVYCDVPANNFSGMKGYKNDFMFDMSGWHDNEEDAIQELFDRLKCIRELTIRKIDETVERIETKYK